MFVIQRRGFRPLVVSAVVAAGLCLACAAFAQTAADQSSTADGIYLPEPEVIAEPQIVGQETVKHAYGDGKPRIEQNVAKFSDDHYEAHGAYREFHPNGQVFIEGQFERGRREGEWSFWFENGQLNRKCSYSNGQPNGSWDVFRADGTLKAKRSFKNGLRDGTWLTYDDAGKQVLNEEQYAQGKADGLWKVWFPNGKPRLEAGYKLGQRHGPLTEWNEKGEKVRELNFVEDKLDGPAFRVTPDGRRVEEVYKDGRPVPKN